MLPDQIPIKLIGVIKWSTISKALIPSSPAVFIDNAARRRIGAGRAVLEFTDFGTWEDRRVAFAKKTKHRLVELCVRVFEHDMPLAMTTILH